MILTLSGGIMARKLNILNKWPTTGTVAACIVVITCYAGNNSKFSGYLPHTGTSAGRIKEESSDSNDFFALPPLSSKITKSDLASSESAERSTTEKTNSIPPFIKRDFRVSSELTTQTNTGIPTVVLSNVSSRPVPEGFGEFINPILKDGQSKQATLADLLLYFSSSGNGDSSTGTNSVTGRKTP